MQADAFIPFSPSCSVFHITLNSMTNGRELCPDLMVTTGMQLNFNQRIIIPSFQNIITQSRFFSAFFRAFENNGFVVFAVFLQKVLEVFPSVKLALNNGPVGFLSLSFFERLIHALQAFGSSSKKDHSRSRPIQTVNNSAKNIAWLVEFLFQVRLDMVGQGDIPSFITLDKISWTLINSNQVIVFVNDI